MDTIGFYISSHGFGHLTRSLVIIEKLLKKTDAQIYIVSGAKQLEFAKLYLSEYLDRLSVSELTTDIGLINHKNKLSIDKEALELKLCDFIESWDRVVDNELDKLKNFNIKMIVTDISPIGALVAKKLNIKCYAISNFTWVELYKKLGVNERIIDEFISAYKNIDEFIEYSLRLPSIHRFGKSVGVGLISREIDFSRVKEIKETCGRYVLFTFGQSAELNQINADDYQGNIIVFDGVEIFAPHVTKLPLETVDTQNYIAASSLVIGKAGWGTIAESLISGVPLVLIERPDVYEDTYMINQLKKQKLAISIDEKKLLAPDINEIYTQAMKYIDFNKLKQVQNDIKSIIEILLRHY
jgi:uncharacterized protein (TIGR00661 family)